jgi:hypothetical protein
MHTRFLSSGGRIEGAPAWAGWFGDGGRFTATRPTLLGVGERGTKEDVIVRPRGPRPPAGARARVGGRDITVHIGEIVNNRRGDIKRMIKQEVGEAFDELAAELDSQGTENEEALL